MFVNKMEHSTAYDCMRCAMGPFNDDVLCVFSDTYCFNCTVETLSSKTSSRILTESILVTCDTCNQVVKNDADFMGECNTCMIASLQSQSQRASKVIRRCVGKESLKQIVDARIVQRLYKGLLPITMTVQTSRGVKKLTRWAKPNVKCPLDCRYLY